MNIYFIVLTTVHPSMMRKVKVKLGKSGILRQMQLLLAGNDTVPS